eukprot:comp23984_c0_seq1/m.42582 comp23984_c0_seq1/g.42582  ORF comp23984_c0_seq1/g.42582 comp23984_c0_seq1/m.42582 type:complete len:1117 (-) comp23984_c0_seq1:240-3590(-)
MAPVPHNMQAGAAVDDTDLAPVAASPLKKGSIASAALAPRPSIIAASRRRSTEVIPVEFERKTETVSGRSAVAHVGYSLSDISFVYPSAPSAYLGEEINGFVRNGEQNAFGQVGKTVRLQVKSGAGSAVHGALSTGELSTVFTSSEGLRHFHPNLHRVSQDRLPAVFHVEARSLSSELVVGVDHSEVVGVRHTGASILSSHSVQEAHDMAVIAHLVALRARLPVVHFYDGAFTGAEVATVNHTPSEQLAKVAAKVGDVAKFREQRQQRHTVAPPPKQEVPEIVDSVMRELSDTLGVRYSPFEYVGAPDAQHVVVVMGHGAQVFHDMVRLLRVLGAKVGVLKVRLYRPWSAERFLAAIPATVKSLAVIDATSANGSAFGPLYLDVVASVHNGSFDASAPLVVGGRLQGKGVSAAAAKAVFDNLAQPTPRNGFTVGAGTESDLATGDDCSAVPEFIAQYQLWDMDADGTAHALADGLRQVANASTLHVQLQQQHDTYQHGGVVNTHLRISPVPFTAPYSVLHADVVAVNNVGLVGKYDFVASLNQGGTLLLNTDWTAEQLEEKLPAALKRQLAEAKAQVYLLDAAKVAYEIDPNYPAHQVLLAALVFLGDHADGVHAEQFRAALPSLFADHLALKRAVAAADKGEAALTKVGVPAGWAEAKDPEPEDPKEKEAAAAAAAVPLRKAVDGNILPHSAYGIVPVPQRKLSKWHQAAWQAIFREEYATEDLVHPAEKGCYTVTLTENKRLTPSDYERNVFHLEMDIRGTGLRYEIGDALGVYGHNDDQEVREFIHWYGLKADDVVSVSRNKERPGFVETRTVYHWLEQVLDLFGRPSKRFYEQLADLASDPVEKEKLLTIASADGKEDFKARVDEAVTYAELLREFPSAHPSIQTLIEIVPAIKPRHYSIASSMKMHPDSVHLLVVLHDWTTPSGAYKVGQCTRYLVDLPVGSKMTVSVKPSVMVLPPRHEQPVIMSGLGTGMAPFRAFIQERAYHKARGVKVGPMVLYFGSRSCAQEYLYGEELEAYAQDGLLTGLRLAFSRDQPHKVYIQHKMAEDKEILNKYLNEGDGHFYLCGPTWPAGDVRDAIVGSFVQAGGLSEADANMRLINLKEEERYILEVY